MTRKERSFVLEGGAIGFATLLGIFVVPSLISERDSVTAVAGFLLLAGWAVWIAYFIYRINRENI